MSERIALVEVDLERCSLTYSSAPCTASVGVTGADKCFNCLATCQDKTNYAAETVTTTYSYASGDLPRNIDAIPNVKSIDFRPAKLELGESIGIRASVTVSFGDSRSPDTGPDGDRYLVDRNYDPYTRGTYWGKFRARYPYTKGSNIRILRGTNDQSKDQMEIRHFIIDKVAGPTSSGQFTIVCKDALKLVDGKQAQAPILSKGEVTADFDNAVTSFDLSPTGIIDDYPATGFINIGGKEICSYTKGVGDTLNIIRAQKNTPAEYHKLGERVQLCLVYAGQKCTDIISDLLQTYSNVPASYIPISDWHIEDDNFIDRLYSATVAEPEAAKKLINELLQQTASSLWWDDTARLLKFRVLRAVDSDAAEYNDDIIVSGSFSAVDQPDKRVSQVWTYYGQLNPLEKLDEKKNYSNSLATLASESEENYGEPSIKSIFSRWIAQDNRDAAERLNLLILSRYSTPPRMFSFGLQRDQFNSLTAPELGGGYKVNNWTIQDPTGAPISLPVQSVQVRTSDTGYSVMAEEVLYSETVAPPDPNVKTVYVDTSQNNYNLYNAASAIYTINSGDTVNVFVSSGITVNSQFVGQPAFALGSGWPTNVTISIVNNGSILGRGGSGGAGGGILSSGTLLNGSAGGNGSEALLISGSSYTSLSIENNGLIGGGGGGGGGGGAAKGVTDAGTGGAAFVGIAGSSGGGGTSNGQGTTGGVVERPNSEINVPINGNNGSSASELAIGNGGASKSLAGSISTVTNGSGGNGGNFGQAGQVGQNGQSGNEGTSLGGTGGQPGNAINKNGNTVTITNNGTIAGNIAS